MSHTPDPVDPELRPESFRARRRCRQLAALEREHASLLAACDDAIERSNDPLAERAALAEAVRAGREVLRATDGHGGYIGLPNDPAQRSAVRLDLYHHGWYAKEVEALQPGVSRAILFLVEDVLAGLCTL